MTDDRTTPPPVDETPDPAGERPTGTVSRLDRLAARAVVVFTAVGVALVLAAVASGVYVLRPATKPTIAVPMALRAPLDARMGKVLASVMEEGPCTGDSRCQWNCKATVFGTSPAHVTSVEQVKVAYLDAWCTGSTTETFDSSGDWEGALRLTGKPTFRDVGDDATPSYFVPVFPKRARYAAQWYYYGGTAYSYQRKRLHRLLHPFG